MTNFLTTTDFADVSTTNYTNLTNYEEDCFWVVTSFLKISRESH